MSATFLRRGLGRVGNGTGRGGLYIVAAFSQDKLWIRCRVPPKGLAVEKVLSDRALGGWVTGRVHKSRKTFAERGKTDKRRDHSEYISM